MIEQQELSKVVQMREELKDFRQRIKILEAVIGDEEQSILIQIKAGQVIEEGSWFPVIVREMKRATVSWKDLVLELKGRSFVEEKLLTAERQEIEKLVISYGG